MVTIKSFINDANILNITHDIVENAINMRQFPKKFQIQKLQSILTFRLKYNGNNYA